MFAIAPTAGGARSRWSRPRQHDLDLADIGRLPAPAPGMEPRPPTAAVPAAAAPTATVPTATVPAAAVPTGHLHGGSRGDRRRLSRSGRGRGDRCGTDCDRGSARRQHRCDVLQSDSHNGTSLRWPICLALPGLRSIGPITSPQTPIWFLRLAGRQSGSDRRLPWLCGVRLGALRAWRGRGTGQVRPPR